MSATRNIADYVDEKGFNIAALARKTGIPYQTLYESLSKNSKRSRQIKADELLKICAVLEVNPMDFADKVLHFPSRHIIHKPVRL